MYKAFIMFSGLLIAGFVNTAKAQEPENLASYKETVEKYHQNGEYDKDISKVVSDARKYMALRITENNQKQKKQKLALVLDIDETAISNYSFMQKNMFGGSIKDFDAHIRRDPTPAIQPVLELFKFAQKNNISVFFVTGRKEYLRYATIHNLKKAGYNKWQRLYLKPNNYHQSSIVPFKTSIRKRIESKGFTIIESIGDQQSDLLGGYAEKTFKLPNPYYKIS